MKRKKARIAFALGIVLLLASWLRCGGPRLDLRMSRLEASKWDAAEELFIDSFYASSASTIIDSLTMKIFEKEASLGVIIFGNQDKIGYFLFDERGDSIQVVCPMNRKMVYLPHGLDNYLNPNSRIVLDGTIAFKSSRVAGVFFTKSIKVSNPVGSKMLWSSNCHE